MSTRRPRPSSRRLLGVACLAIASLTAGGVYADDADAHIARGISLREHGNDAEALDEFRRAYAITPTPKARAQIALAEQALGTWVPAERDLTEAMRAASDPWIAKNQRALQGALETIGQHLGTLELRVEPSATRGGDVVVDGARQGTLPLSGGIRVEAGSRTLEVRVPGFYPVSRTVLVPPGGVARETIELHAQEQPAAATPPAPSTPSHPGDGGSEATSGPKPPEGGGRSGGGALGTVGWVFVGTSVALIATGVVGQFVRQGNISSYNNDPTCPGQGSATQPASCADLVRSAQTWNTVSIVSFIGGGVFASSGIVLLLVNGSSGSSSHTASLRCGPFGCAGTF